jgi:hypothetical protein
LLPWNPNVDGTIHTLVLGPSSIYLGGDFFLAGGKTRTNLAELDLVTAQATTWAPPVGPIVHALAPGVVGAIYTAGTFTSPMNHLASCNFFSGSVVPNWNPDANGDVNALVVSGSRVIIGGAFTIVHGTQKWRLAALETDIPGLPVDSWNHDFLSGEVNALAVNGPVLYAGGTFPEGNGLAAMDVATGTGLSWDPRLGGGRVNALLVDGPTLYVAGTFKRIARHAQQGVAAITSSVVSVAQGPAPNEIQLGIPFPNPTSQGVTVELGLPSPASVSVAVYDVRGRRVMRWAPRPYGESRARVTWDGRDGAGRAVAPGLYFLEVNVGDRSLKRRIAIVR